MKRKLNNNDGVTILIALVGFLIAAMISVVIVTAASSSALRVINDRKTNQAHLSLESAAKIVQEGMEDTTYTFKYSSEDNEKIDTKNDVTASGMFASEMEYAISTVETSGIAKGNVTLTLTKGTSSVDQVKDVTASFIMKNGSSEPGEKYWVYFTFTVEGSKQEVYLTLVSKITPLDDGSGQYQMSWKSESLKSIDDYSEN